MGTIMSAIQCTLPRILASVLTACVVLWASITLAGTGDGTVLGSTNVLDNGPLSERFNLVVMGDGFTAGEQGAFNNAVDQLMSAILSEEPLDTLSAAFNVIRINVASDQSGADEPSPCFPEDLHVNTYFDATFCTGGIPRALVVNNSIVYQVANTYTPGWDQVVVIVNSTRWGGTGGSVGVTSLASGWEGIVIHEFGHSAFGFADEYEYYAGCGETGHDYHSSAEPLEPNVTTKFKRSEIKWNHLILLSTQLPTTENLNCSICDPQGNPYPSSTVGIYEGAHYYHCDCYRPQFHCMMRDLAPFCAVCREVIVATMTPYLPAPPCDCPHQFDFDEDAEPTALDLSALIDVMFYGATNIQDPDCPASRGDFDNNGAIDALDLNAVIDYLFFGGSGPCNPCDPVQASCGS